MTILFVAIGMVVGAALYAKYLNWKEKK